MGNVAGNAANHGMTLGPPTDRHQARAPVPVLRLAAGHPEVLGLGTGEKEGSRKPRPMPGCGAVLAQRAGNLEIVGVTERALTPHRDSGTT